MTRHRSRHLLVPLVITASLLWVALIVMGDGTPFERAAEPDGLPQSMGCGEPGAASFSRLRATPQPCDGLALINLVPRRRKHHDQHRTDQAPG